MLSFTLKTCEYFQYYSTCRPATMNCVEVVQGYRHTKIDAVRSILGWALCVPNAMSEFELCETYLHLHLRRLLRRTVSGISSQLLVF